MRKTVRTRLIIGSLDTLFVVISFLIMVIIKPNFSPKNIDTFYSGSVLVFVLIWIMISHLSNKFRINSEKSLSEILTSVFTSNFIILAIVSVIIILFTELQYPRLILFGTILLATFFELMLALLYYALLQSDFLQEWIGPEYINDSLKTGKKNGNGTRLSSPQPLNDVSKIALRRNYENLVRSIAEESGSDVAEWIASQIDIIDPRTLILVTETRFNVDNQPDNFFTTIVNLSRINDIQRINKFFESVNAKLPDGGIFIGCGETYLLRKKRILKKYPKGLNYLVYTNDFIFKRVMPKIKLTRKFYFLLTRGKNRVISKTEALGRLYSCGFEIVEEKPIHNLLFWKAKKIKVPEFDYHPTYGLIIRLKRIGRGGRQFNVYKFRTMHAYSEYVQEYIYKNNQLDKTGKFKDDYRVTTLGKFLRKFWLDELPMIINVLKGDMKIVGVRPLSNHFFGLYSHELQEMRIKYRPGLIPPYYAQFPTPKSLDEVQANERQYLVEYTQHPFLTDCKYFFLAMNNILLKKARSK